MNRHAPLVPVAPARGPIDAATDRAITAAAIRAKHSPAVRDALYTALAPRIMDIVRRYRRSLRTRDLDDLAQDAFVAFCDVLADWPSHGSFPAYLFGRFPWELRCKVRGAMSPTHAAAYVDEALELIERLAATLPTPDGDIFLWRVRDGESFATISDRLGWSRDTASRTWYRIAADLRAALARTGGRPGRPKRPLQPG